LPRRRFRIRTPLLVCLAALLVTLLAYIFALPQYQAYNSPLFEPSELYIPRMIDAVIVVWCFWLGSSIGSFLNVVAWRLPRGESINGRSRCPRCCTQLLARDNFPVFGWLALGGRCRTCRLVISPRYPIVEAVVGLSITLVSIAELYRLSLPRQVVHWHDGPFWAPTVDHLVLMTLLYHVTVLTFGWAFGLIRIDKHRLPARLMGLGLAAAVVPMLVYPMLMVVPWQMTVPEFWWPEGLYADALVRVVTALVAATVIGRYLARGICPTADPKLDPLGPSTARLIDLIAILALAIIVVGWQSSPALTVFASLLAVGIRRCLPAECDSLGRFAIAIPLALTIHLVLWRHLDGLWFWPSDGGSPWVFLAWVGLVGLIPWWLRDEGREELVELVELVEGPVADEDPEEDEDEDPDATDKLNLNQ
jgi:leader peptidase (prepilin peptidase)/N-methyltransferase